MTPLQIKLCGFTRPEDARVAVAEGADMIGLILWAPSPRAITADDARRIREVVPAGVPLVGVFVDEEPDTIDELVDEIGLDRVQLHGAESRDEILRYGERALRGVRDGDASAVPDGVPVVFDGPFCAHGEPRRARGALGGGRTLGATSATCCWRAGSTPENVADAVRGGAAVRRRHRARHRVIARHQGSRSAAALRRRGQGGRRA